MNAKVHQRAIEILNEAREKMNDKGRHWIKGRFRGKNKKGEDSFCSIGALRSVSRKTKARKVATIALAELIDPKRMEARREVLENFHGKKEGREIESALYNEAESIIIRYNDGYRTRWSGVSSKFKKAAKTLEKELKNAK